MFLMRNITFNEYLCFVKQQVGTLLASSVSSGAMFQNNFNDKMETKYRLLIFLNNTI